MVSCAGRSNALVVSSAASVRVVLYISGASTARFSPDLWGSCPTLLSANLVNEHCARARIQRAIKASESSSHLQHSKQAVQIPGYGSGGTRLDPKCLLSVLFKRGIATNSRCHGAARQSTTGDCQNDSRCPPDIEQACAPPFSRGRLIRQCGMGHWRHVCWGICGWEGRCRRGQHGAMDVAGRREKKPGRKHDATAGPTQPSCQCRSLAGLLPETPPELFRLRVGARRTSNPTGKARTRVHPASKIRSTKSSTSLCFSHVCQTTTSPAPRDATPARRPSIAKA